MNVTLVKALVALIPTAALFVRAAFRLRREGNAAGVLHLCGSAFLAIVVFTHITEGLHILEFMGWGERHSAGHYVDLSSAILAVTLLSAAYWLERRSRQS